MSYLCRVAGLSLSDSVRSSKGEPFKGIGLEPLLLCAERSQMRWFGHLVRMLPRQPLRDVFRPCPTGRTRWKHYLSRLAWARLGIPLEVLNELAGVWEVWASLLRLQSARSNPGKAIEDGCMYVCNYKWDTHSAGFCYLIHVLLL